MTRCACCDKATTNPRYCSRSCAATHTNRLHPRRKKTPRYCRQCGTPVHFLPGRRMLCFSCNPHHVDWSSVTLADVRGQRRYQKHSRLRALARQAYVSAGRPLRCAVCGYDAHVEVCHARALKDFPASAIVTEVNAQANLVALCPNHHWEFDRGRLDLSSVGFPEFDRLHPAGFPAGALELKKSVALSG